MLKFRNFIGSRKALISLIAVFAVFLAALLGIWFWLSRTGDPPRLGITNATSQPTDGQMQASGQPDPTAHSTAPIQTSPGNVPTEPSGAIPTEPNATEPPTTENPTTSPGGNTNPDSSDKPPKSENHTPQAPPPDQPAQALVTYDQFSLYSGQFVEDGTDDPVTNVAAILVTNRSGQFLDLATLSFEIDGREATFLVSGLPAGRSAWVLEASRMTATNSSTFTFVDMITAFRENVVYSTDKVSFTCVGNLVTATNKTNEKLENVFVYYRIIHTDGNYLGGITYVIDFGTLDPGVSVEKLAGHFSAEKARIIRIGWSGQ